MKTELDDCPFPTDEPAPAPPPKVNGVHSVESFETAIPARFTPAPPTASRTLPHSLEAEESLLSAILIDPEPLLERCAAAKLSGESFYDPRHGIIYETLQRMRTAQHPIDASTLAQELQTARQLEQVGGFAFVVQVSNNQPTTLQASYFLNTVLEKAVLRAVVRTATSAIEDCYAFTGDLPALTQDIRRRLDFASAYSLTKEPDLQAIPLTAFEVPPDNDRTILLGRRFLCRGDGMVVVSSSGMGKSSLTLQAAVCWALALHFLGILPNGPLKSLIIQAEDSPGDIGEVWASICHKLNLTAEQLAQVRERVIVVTDRIHRGPSFLAELKRQVDFHQPDLVWINPLASFMAGDGTTQQVVGDFLRAGLNGINAAAKFAYIVIQHTTKPATGNQRGPARQWHEVMYDMAGSYDIIGWARAIISLRPTPEMGEFNLVLAKRGRRAGVTKRVPHGVGYRLENTTSIPVKHSSGMIPVPSLGKEIPAIFWEEREEIATESVPEKSAGRPKKHDLKDFLHVFPESASAAIGINELLREVLKSRHMSKSTLYDLINDGLAQSLIICNTSNPKAPCYFRKPPAPKPTDPSLDF